MYIHNDSSCIIFLHDRFFKKKSFFSSSSYKKIIKELENKGITVASITDIINYQNSDSNSNSNSNSNTLDNDNTKDNKKTVTFNNIPEYDIKQEFNNTKELSVVTNSLLIEPISITENENESESDREHLKIPEKTSLSAFNNRRRIGKYNKKEHDKFFNNSVNSTKNEKKNEKKNSNQKQKQHKILTLSFDDKLYPEVNCLYFHLFEGQYYNDSIYIKRKVEKEREMLLLLAGKLGVKNLSYHTTTTETILSHVDASINVKGFDNHIQYTKNKLDHTTTSSEEFYQNRGATVYLNSKSREQLDYNIEKSLGTMKSKIFSYDYYKTNAKLEAFVYKRFVFKMEKMDYMIDVEDISEKSFIVKTCFMNYGLGVRVDKNISYSESIKYQFVFYTDKELRMELMKIARQDEDNFLIIREIYDSDKDKIDQSVHYISDYVKNEAYKLKYITNLQKYIIDVGFDKFYGLCHQFNNSSQIRDWLYTMDYEYNEKDKKKIENEKVANEKVANEKVANEKDDNVKFINNNIPKNIDIDDTFRKSKDNPDNIDDIDEFGYRILEMTSPGGDDDNIDDIDNANYNNYINYTKNNIK